MKVRVHRAVFERGQPVGVLFGRANGRDVYVLEDPIWVLDAQLRLEEAGGPIDIWLDANKVAVLPK